MLREVGGILVMSHPANDSPGTICLSSNPGAFYRNRSAVSCDTFCGSLVQAYVTGFGFTDLQMRNWGNA